MSSVVMERESLSVRPQLPIAREDTAGSPSPSTAGSYLTSVDQSLSQMTAKWLASKQGAWSGHARHVQRLQHRHFSCCGDRNAAGLAVVRAASAVGLAQAGSTALPVNVPAQPTHTTHSQPRVTQQHTSSSGA